MEVLKQKDGPTNGTNKSTGTTSRCSSQQRDLSRQTMFPYPFLRASGTFCITIALSAVALVATAQEESVVDKLRLTEILAGDTPETIDELRALQAHIQQLAKRVLPAVVSIPDSTTASGVLVRRDDKSYVLSAGHVTRSVGRELVIRTDDLRFQGVTLGANHRSDMGLIRVETNVEHPTVEIGTSADLKAGQWVMTLGHPNGRKPGRSAPVRLGRFLGVSKFGYLMTDSTGQMGDSGGPLFDMSGRMIGIHSHGSQSLAVSMQAPIDALVAQWGELVEGKVTQVSRLDGWAMSLASRLAQGSSLSQGETMRQLCNKIVESVNPSVVRVCVGDQERALGTVVAPDLVITKYSELDIDDRDADRTCRQAENSWTYSIVGYDAPADLALLRIDGARLRAITWHKESPNIGSFLASPDGDAEPIGIGVLSAAPYRLTPPYAVLGVWFKNWGEGPAELQEVFGSAQDAGLRGGDVVVRFGSERVDNSQQVLGLV
ncbi:MAG: serine protease, partial [Planctomycetota bacterium]